MKNLSHPGEVLMDEYLELLGMPGLVLAEHLTIRTWFRVRPGEKTLMSGQNPDPGTQPIFPAASTVGIHTAASANEGDTCDE